MDAYEKLQRLGLKSKQDREAVYVLMHCASREAAYNEYYAHLGSKLCSSNHNYKFTFQFAFWDKLKGTLALLRPCILSRTHTQSHFRTSSACVLAPTHVLVFVVCLSDHPSFCILASFWCVLTRCPSFRQAWTRSRSVRSPTWPSSSLTSSASSRSRSPFSKSALLPFFLESLDDVGVREREREREREDTLRCFLSHPHPPSP